MFGGERDNASKRRDRRGSVSNHCQNDKRVHVAVNSKERSVRNNERARHMREIRPAASNLFERYKGALSGLSGNRRAIRRWVADLRDDEENSR